ncbi:hypothetical protein K4A83_09335 [Spirulina subsalsa FACHB-351]|uniref:Pyridoxamine 5'-phosphate oxidase Alr4036 family FMN-binding domain-containing protein n=2 Tax=Spirulina subsalsa TaxID=54311 RepID=A0ABT3L4N3_9CYAN|nr:hypothetical protein [Spirulina subsalsa FACHB-351]
MTSTCSEVGECVANPVQMIDDHYPHATGQQLRLETWQSLSDAARLQFAWPTPKAPREPNPEAFRPPPPSPEIPLPTFCLLCLSPQRVEHLELRGDPQNRWLFWLDEGNLWQQQGVNP